MKRSKKLLILPAILLFVIGTALGVKLESAMSTTDTLEQLRKLENAFLIVDQRYVEDVDADRLAEAAIEGILDDLDPHSSYISAADIAEVQESYRGSFGGVGIWYEIIADTARVVSTIDGGPSESAGVQAGDRIIAIDDSTAIGLNTTGVQKRLKGEIGTPVTMTIERFGVPEPVAIEVVRDKIPLYSVTGSYMVDDQTGYIRVSRFAQTTYREFRDKMTELRGQGMERLIVDLRDNPGGVMDAAVNMVDEMLPDDKTIVYTKGRTVEDQLFKSGRTGMFESQPVIVLVNARSASASEIVAGALQDHDRALIVGQRTFGKGLVQNQFPLPDGSVLQMTTARYYTPTGRLIQTPYEGGGLEDYYADKFSDYDDATFDPSAYKESIPDSLKFTTAHGRTVFGGGGILPDYVIAPDTMLNPVLQATYSGAFGTVYRTWFTNNEESLRTTWGDRQQAFLDSYDVSDADWQAFWEIAQEQDFTLTDDPDAADADDGVFARNDIAAHRATIETYLKAMVARQLFGSETAMPLFNQINPVFQQALTLWEDADALADYYQSGAEELGRSGE